jgi:hypothetical protein
MTFREWAETIIDLAMLVGFCWLLLFAEWWFPPLLAWAKGAV